MKKLLLCCIAALCLLTCCTSKNDETEIKKVLEKESATWRAADVKGHASCWQVMPYSRILVSLANGNTFDVKPQLMVNPLPNGMGHGGISFNSNYKIHIEGNTAEVSHDELSIAKDGRKSYSYEIRLLEKINGEWKLTGQSIHLYDPKQK